MDQTEYQRWQGQRRAAVIAPTGNLALVRFQPVTAKEEAIEEIPATVYRVADQAGVWLRAAKESLIMVDGEVVDGLHFVGRLQPSGKPLIRHGRYSMDAFSLDGSDYELRIYDARAEHLSKFDRIAYYDYDPSLVVQGQYEAYGDSDQIPWEFTRSSDTGHTKQVPGKIKVELGGQPYELLAFTDGPLLVLVYADGTTGKESYAPGRFLKMPLPSDSGTVTLDFNQTFIPPCGFSYSYSCPIPPRQNRIAAPIRGGEREVLWKD